MIMQIVAFILLLIISILMLLLIRSEFTKMVSYSVWIDCSIILIQNCGSGVGGFITYASYSKFDKCRSWIFLWICISVPFISVFISLNTPLFILSGVGIWNQLLKVP